MNTLRKKLIQLDGKGYKALKSIQGHYKDDLISLHIDYIQGDPFASPSRIRVIIPLEKTDIDAGQYSSHYRKIAAENFLAMEIANQIRQTPSPVKGTGKSGLVYIDAPGQAIIERTAVKMMKDVIEIRLSIGLPARGRSILGKQAEKLLCDYVPSIIEKSFTSYSRDLLQKYITLADDQETIREYIRENNIVSFVGSGAILPRESGVSQRPMKGEEVITFQSPKEYEVTIPLPYGRTVTGMGIPAGITIIVGGGFHGKSTLLQGIERGVYNHKLGDGREYVITDNTAMKIRSEDGRSVHQVDISPFISDLPFGKPTNIFSTEDASGSTSQATNIMEAIEMETRLLLIDEDTSATNFMIRDGRMQKLVKKEKEPITPFIDRVEQLYSEKGVSSILVIGGSGDYFEVADHVIMMDEYAPYDRTSEAKEISDEITKLRFKESVGTFSDVHNRKLERYIINKKLGQKEKIDSKSLSTILIGREQLQLQGLEQLIDQSQTRAIANIIKFLAKEKNGPKVMKEAIDHLYKQIQENGLDILSPYKGQHPGDLALPRKNEVAAALNRIRY
ncbi:MULTISPECIES: ABC-ATPase domain-containing protein [Bacillaceae]|uniref:ABC-ATPase domain-containing protein n=1 Tax=Evansella alkalicola TaxID=745819 RepID=A0ABS6JND6_9BACI|nr:MULTISPECIES: ABC-ATPase domain-containing protein [Bacillaceae]MBU9720064.1 ABC-ATPase domain-containing protein [Bacillus alkalicola]